MQDIFLSYATQDRDRLTPLVDVLEAQGWTVFWDHRSIKVSEDWHDVVGAAIQQCSCVIVVWSEASVTSRWVKEEALIARDRGVLYPVRIDLVAPPFGFTTIQAADFMGWEGEAAHQGLIDLQEQLAVRLNLRPVEELAPEVVQQTKLKKESTAVLWPQNIAGLTAERTKPFTLGGGFKVTALFTILLVIGWVSYQLITANRSISLNLAYEVDQKAVSERKLLPFEPKMVKIKAGEFQMGCDPERDGKCNDNELPLHKVTVPSFWMSEAEVTVGQYLTCVDAGACPEPEWREKGGDYHIETGKNDLYKKMGGALTGINYPIVGVSWNNANTYVAWLREQTGEQYRLPTEAEWEYVSRAGKETTYSWGDFIGKNNANCADDLCGDSYKYTSPVDTFSANPFGLKDMYGNVWEWVEDCKKSYNDTLADGSAVQGCETGVPRVLRGGSWYITPEALRSASRYSNFPSYRNITVGFRAARAN